MVTPAKSWRQAREEGIEFTLPSGNVASIRPVEVDLFVRLGYIPDALAPLILRYINGEVITLDLPIHEELEKSKEWLRFLDELVKFAFVSPVVRDTPKEGEPPLGDNEISVDDVGYADKTHLYRVIFGRPAARLRAFLEQINALASVVSVPDNAPEAVEDAQDQPLGEPDHRNARHVDRATA